MVDENIYLYTLSTATQSLLAAVDGSGHKRAQRYHAANQEVLVTNDLSMRALNVNTGKMRIVVDRKKMMPFLPIHGVTNMAKMSFGHAKWSPDGSMVYWEMNGGGRYGSGKGEPRLFTAKADGTDIVEFSPDFRPMHAGLWDNDSIYGHDDRREGGKLLKRWTRDGTEIEVLAGPGCHPAVSPDRKWIATESWYGSEPIVLRLYSVGSTVATAELYSQPRVGSESLWTVRSHMDPVFSVDGQYVYFNAWPPDEAHPQLMRVDVTQAR